jgi:hypothetical protein
VKPNPGKRPRRQLAAKPRFAPARGPCDSCSRDRKRYWFTYDIFSSSPRWWAFCVFCIKRENAPTIVELER